MKQSLYSLIAGVFLVAFIFSIAQTESCYASVRVGKSLVKKLAGNIENNCARETHIVGRGVVPKLN